MRFILFITLLAFFFNLDALDTCRIALDLKEVKRDRVKVEINKLSFNSDTIKYYMPKVSPGTYSVKNYGRFIHKLKGYDKNGKKVRFKQSKCENIFTTEEGKKLSKIVYYVDDGWDKYKDDNYIFPPAATNIEEKENFVINHYGFWGYFKNHKNIPYKLTVNKPKGFYTSTPAGIIRNKEKDIIFADNYYSLTDNPLMYCKPDTLSYKYKNTNIYISVYSKNEVNNSKHIKYSLNRALPALDNFFGELPVKEYHFMVYFTGYQQEKLNEMSQFGGMEHKNCSFYLLPELYSKDYFKIQVTHILIHEFLHTITPLNLHDKGIQNFNFNNPLMSKHLWLYEGATEYFANLVMLQNDIIQEKDFAEIIRSKILKMNEFKNDTFTVMSKNILKSTYNESYMNVYSKGPILSFLLDLKIRKETNGEETLKSVIFKLYEKYKDSAFHDDSLFKEIAELSHHSVKPFINKYIASNDSLPFEELLPYLNWEYHHKKEMPRYSFGVLTLELEEGKNLVVTKGDAKSNRFGLKKGDILLYINDISVTLDNHYQLAQKLYYPKKNKKITIKYKRGNKKKFTWATPAKFVRDEYHVIKINENGKRKIKLTE